MTRLATRLAQKYTPKIIRDNGDLDSDYNYKKTLLVVRATLREAAIVARNPYSNAVKAYGRDEPLAVGKKISEAIKNL